ncbi:MAG: hypothetical protein Q9228_000268 [Teloschistes exilis]
MDDRESLDRSSAEVAPSMPVPDSNVGYHTTEGALESERVQHAPPNAPGNESPEVVAVLRSDIGINTLLTRLKQSVASAREFAAFLKKRSSLEEEHAQGMKKLCKGSHESSRRPDNRQGGYAQHYNEVIGIHDRLTDNGIQFALSLHQMQEDLHDLALNIERGRKQWKQTGLSAEKRVQDSESLMEKAKAKYDSLAEDYDRARTGDKQSGRVFGLKGPKSAAQHEEDLNRKMQAADSDYASKVQIAQTQRQELVVTQRPQAVRAILDLIHECDSGLTLQLQKFANLNEKLFLSNGLCVSPLNGHNNEQTQRSLRDVVYQIDNAQDLNHYIASFATRVAQQPTEIKYHPHPEQYPSPGYVPPQNASEQHSQGSPRQHTFPANGEPTPTQQSSHTQLSSPLYPQSSMLAPSQNSDLTHPELPPLRPVFGVSLDDLLKRDGSAIPLVVYQCLQAVDLFGLDVEGIYRLSGSAMHVSKLQAIFDNDSSQVDFRNPETFYHDVNSVAGLLKQFFRDLPDPLLTHEHFQSFIEAARESKLCSSAVLVVIGLAYDSYWATRH